MANAAIKVLIFILFSLPGMSIQTVFLRPTFHNKYSRSLMLAKPKQVICVSPGLVHIKGALTEEEQVKFADVVLNLGERPDGKGFYTSPETLDKVLNVKPHRGRMYEEIKDLPSFKEEGLTDKICRSIKDACEIDPNLIYQEPTHVIMLMYKRLAVPPADGYIPWHIDNGKNDGDDEYPIVNLALGETCNFLVSFDRKPKLAPGHGLNNPVNLAHCIKFESGDMLIVGGPARFMLHAIHEIFAGTCPNNLAELKNHRINLTFRHTPKVNKEDFSTSTLNNLEPSKKFNNQFFTAE